nr:MAG TPA: hypothetical protein [Caudoviricetes sp.]
MENSLQRKTSPPEDSYPASLSSKGGSMKGFGKALISSHCAHLSCSSSRLSRPLLLQKL